MPDIIRYKAYGNVLRVGKVVEHHNKEVTVVTPRHHRLTISRKRIRISEYSTDLAQYLLETKQYALERLTNA